MTEKQQVEKTANDVFSRMRLHWVVASVEQNSHSRTWDLEVQVPDGHELLLTVPHGSWKEIKQAIREQTEEELDRLELHRR